MTDYLASLEKIATEVTARDAANVDKNAEFPSATVSALAGAGLLGLLSSKEVGGLGLGPRQAAQVVERLARECGSSAMVVCMHYAGAAVIEKLGTEGVRNEIAAGKHLTTLAFSEAGSRSHFWAPLSTAKKTDQGIQLDAKKSWVTSANQADSYVWSSGPVAAEGASTIWLVPRKSAGIQLPGAYDGLGLRGNDSTPITAEGVVVDDANRLGEDGKGFDAMMEIVLPFFNVMNAACSIGLMEGAISRCAKHLSATQHEHLGSALCDLPTIRNYVARMRCKTDMARTLWLDTITAMETGRDDVMLRVLQSKAAAGETALDVMATAMRICGGAAYRRDVAVERYFRDAQASSVMAPTVDVLYDFIGKAVCGMDLF
jgi:alkylation response protein AidB-like acyl-CoA dehydrogenase